MNWADELDEEVIYRRIGKKITEGSKKINEICERVISCDTTKIDLFGLPF
jgi:hypothetical protein